jgi:hypothetical protein
MICSRISSLTWGTYLPMPKSERLSVVVASKPTVGRLLLGFANFDDRDLKYDRLGDSMEAEVAGDHELIWHRALFDPGALEGRSREPGWAVQDEIASEVAKALRASIK